MSRFWERQEGESSKAFAAFSTYRDFGPNRSLKSAAELHYGIAGSASKLRQFQTWSSRFDWVSRCEAYDDFLEAVRRGAAEEGERKGAADLFERQQKLRELHLENAERAAKVVKTMLSFPLTTREVEEFDEDGNPVRVIVRPSRWTMAGVPRLMETVWKASGEADRVELEARLEHRGLGLTDEERAEIDALRNDPRAGDFFRMLFPESREDDE